MNSKEYKLQQRQYEILDTMGIVIWKERDFITNSLTKHPHKEALSPNVAFTGPNFQFDCSQNPFSLKINADCWVLIHGNIDSTDTKIVTVLDGMLKVLSLDADRYCKSFVNESLEDSKSHLKLLTALERLLPKTVLVLGSEYGSALLETVNQLREPLPFIVRVTYHPKELVIEPQKKKLAYRALL